MMGLIGGKDGNSSQRGAQTNGPELKKFIDKIIESQKSANQSQSNSNGNVSPQLSIQEDSKSQGSNEQSSFLKEIDDDFK